MRYVIAFRMSRDLDLITIDLMVKIINLNPKPIIFLFGIETEIASNHYILNSTEAYSHQNK